MGKHDGKMTRAAHIKRNTAGTSNELSFSVLDAAKNELESDGRSGKEDKPHRFGRIALFTLPGRKRAVPTPKKEQGLPLSTGDFVSIDEGGSPRASSALPGSLGVLGTKGAGGPARASVAGTPSAVADRAATPAPAFEATPWEAPAEEVSRRKTDRKRRRRVLRIVTLTAVAALVVGAGYWAYSSYQAYQGHLSDLDQTLESISSTDEAIVSLDETLETLGKDASKALSDATTLSTVSATQEALANVSSTLEKAEAGAQEISTSLSDSVDKEAAGQAASAAHARQLMVENGLSIMGDYVDAHAAAALATEAWETLLSADALAREAALLVTATTAENVQSSMAKSKDSLALFEQADAAYADIADQYQNADYGEYRAYIAKRVESINYALASDEAFLNKNKDEAAAQNEAYNAADAEAASLAKGLPTDPLQPVVDAFSSATEEAKGLYATARAQAGTADAFLRDYLSSK